MLEHGVAGVESIMAKVMMQDERIHIGALGRVASIVDERGRVYTATLVLFTGF